MTLRAKPGLENQEPGEKGASLQAAGAADVPTEALEHGPPPPISGGPLEIPGYVLNRMLGQGAYGQVWHAVRITTGQDVAIKIFTRPNSLDWRYLQREVDRLLRVAEHPHIVTILDANFQTRPPFYAMAMLRCGSLADLCRHGRVGADPEQAARWFEQILQALEFAHAKGLLHCDLKPANVLLDEEGNVRLVDFGQAHLRGEAATSLGTLNYMAPEQAVVASEAESPPDPSVSWDIYGVGATMYALLAGMPPHTHGQLHRTLDGLDDIRERLNRYRLHVLNTAIVPLRRINPAVDKDLADIIAHCLAAEPGQRYPNVSALAADLRRRRERRPLACHRHSGPYVVGKFVRRNLGIVSIAAAAILAIATAVFTSYYLYEAERSKLIGEHKEAEAKFQGRIGELSRRLEEVTSELHRLEAAHPADRGGVPPTGSQ